MKTVAIIQARMGSTRLPGKIMMELKGKTVLNHVIERVQLSREIDEIIVATTILEEDNIVEVEAKRYGAKVFRGSSENVLDRYYQAAISSNADHIIRITSDCPLIDPIILNELVQKYNESNCEIATNVGKKIEDRTFPRGLDAEIFSFQTLQQAYEKAFFAYQREHVTPYIYEHSSKVKLVKNSIDYSMYRWTLDTPEDFELISEIYERLYFGKHDFYLSDIVNIFKQEETLNTINMHIQQKEIK